MKKSILVLGLTVLFGLTFAFSKAAYTPGIESHGLYRLYDKYTGEHIYTADYGEAFALRDSHYQLEGVEGSVYKQSFPNSLNLYRLYNPQTNRHFYTTNDSEVSDVKNQGFVLERIEGYLSSDTDSPNGSALVPFYRLYNPQMDDHFYTKSAAERDGATQSGYKFEAIIGYISN